MCTRNERYRKRIIVVVRGLKKGKCGFFLSEEKKSFCEQQGKRRWMKKVVVKKIKFIVKNWRKMLFDKKSGKRTRNTRTISMF